MFWHNRTSVQMQPQPDVPFQSLHYLLSQSVYMEFKQFLSPKNTSSLHVSWFSYRHPAGSGCSHLINWSLFILILLSLAVFGLSGHIEEDWEADPCTHISRWIIIYEEEMPKCLHVNCFTNLNWISRKPIPGSWRMCIFLKDSNKCSINND